jgi:hypothetical protein
VAALTNSLYVNGFRGAIYAGYRGEMPFWTNKALNNNKLNWKGASTLKVTNDLNIHFLPLDTKYHLTNYKPDFMLDLWNKIDNDAVGMFYFDPDIVINIDWNYFLEWIGCGIALCEDVNSPLKINNPRRKIWRKYYSHHNLELKFKDEAYVNGGFIGLKKNDIQFLVNWKKLQDLMSTEIGGLNKSSLKSGGDSISLDSYGYISAFSCTDQDALNATIEQTDLSYSILTKSAMGFTGGKNIMLHALGVPKPWKKLYFLSSLKGIPPTYAEKIFWKYVNQPIILYNQWYVKYKLYFIIFSSFISRFYRRN